MNAAPLAPGQVIRDTYSIVKPLGSGAFGDVYLARHRYMGLQALKVFRRNEGVDALEEAYLLTKLSHPNIVRMFEANEFELGGQRFGYFSMDYVEGGSLMNLSGASLEFDQRFALGQGMLEGLAFAHSQSPPVIHRDVSPSNVLVEKTASGLRAKVSDFGLAKHVDSKSLMASAAGKYLYMAPESFLNIHVTASDVYSAAIVLYQMFTGQHPFGVKLSASADAKEIAAVVRQSRLQSVPDVTGSSNWLDAWWNAFFRAALAHDYEARPRSATELLQLYLSRTGQRKLEPASAPGGENIDGMITEAKQLALQAETLDAAIELLERACHSNPEARSKYSELLLLWKRGIVL